MSRECVAIKHIDTVTSKLIGVELDDKSNDGVDEVSDIVVGDGKSVIGVAASHIVIDPVSRALTNDHGIWKAYGDADKDDLCKAPAQARGLVPRLKS